MTIHLKLNNYFLNQTEENYKYRLRLPASLPNHVEDERVNQDDEQSWFVGVSPETFQPQVSSFDGPPFWSSKF